MEINEVIGQNLQRLRGEQQLSLGQLSERTGVSKAVLSQLENGKGNPTINTLWKIAQAFHVSYSALLEPPRVSVQKVAYEDLAMQSDDEGKYRIGCYYPTAAERNFEVFLLELEPGGCHSTTDHVEVSEEFLLVKEGVLELQVGEETFTLHPGDSLRFDSTQFHQYKNPGKKLLQAYCINFYPGK